MAAKHEELTERSNVLRLDLKIWEREFAAANGGRKASREDIKKNPEIALKYKEYNKTRDILSGKIVEPPPSHHQTPRKRKREYESSQTNSKRLETVKTPSRTPIKPWEVDPYESPSVIQNMFTPSKKTTIGPTPQKDGQVLGLFDFLQDDGLVVSPSKVEGVNGVDINTYIQATPRKPQNALDGHGTVKYNWTPTTSRKQNMFATPMKNRQANGQGGKTPSSVSKLHFSTPSFLRRDSQRVYEPSADQIQEVVVSPQMVRPKRPLVRGLSSMLAGLRKMEDEAADDDLEALHEMEHDMAGGSKPAPKVGKPDEIVLVEESQTRFPLGGFDDEAKYDSEPDELKNPPLERDGQPLKVWKKKGQKRTTRRVKMKPSRAKLHPAGEDVQPDDSDDEASQPEETIQDTQVNDTAAAFADVRNFDSDSQSEYTASEGGTRYRRPDQSKKRKVVTKEGKIRTVARKVNALAHQNFKRLKLRNSGAKGGPGHSSRFRRKK